jgi:hypothetical protein
MMTPSDGDGDGWQWMATTTNDNDDGVIELSASASFVMMACIRENNRDFFFLLRVFFLIFLFVSSTDLIVCSFDHLCKETTKMEIEK